MSFISVLTAIGKGFEKGLTWAVKYALPVESLVALLFPAAGPAAAAAGTSLNLIQSAVLAVEQKYAAAGVQNGTGPQKLAEVLTLVEPAVIEILTKEGIATDSTHVNSIVNAVVAILNVTNGAAVA